MMKEICSGRFSEIVTIEDGCTKGGLFGAVSEYVSGIENGPKVTPIGIPDRFITQASQKELRRECGLDEESIRGVLQSFFKKK